MLAIIETGGKQYKVKEGDKIKVEKIEGSEGEEVKFSEVLFLGNSTEIRVGTPYVKDSDVRGKILEQTKDKKVWGIKHKAKKRYKLKFGHRQPITKIEIIKVK